MKRTPTILERALAYLYESGPTTCKEAEGPVGTRYFNTSVSDIQKKLGIPVRRELRPQTNGQGERYHAMVYWLDERAREAAAHQLEAFETMRQEMDDADAATDGEHTRVMEKEGME